MFINNSTWSYDPHTCLHFIIPPNTNELWSLPPPKAPNANAKMPISGHSPHRVHEAVRKRDKFAQST